ncbi:TlpA disulfide reductase family protein [Salinimicrobium sp. MT39]|jgi:thiol-disulfide isomerase/thioredoxin|uniref:TlpA disulfide reductase family protein n=1 Tax=Salinimicrobium profundisediminis TaxID=2994553 RepID=A0A9X3D0W9_9FLAO|nr:TlpA disulfide reductase family protein [Salinimicrobium profundisediminis]MCX2839214.1 TlpA disulfide reductase family protein [Salinimicrobium profundisediminis]
MNKKLKKNLIEYGIIGAVLIGLFVTGLHTEVFGFLQRGILATGIMDPKIEEKADIAAVTPAKGAVLDLNLVNSKGEKVNMEQFRGKVIFLNFWATWCPPCIAEMPGINKLYQDVKDDNVEFIMLSVDQNFEKAKKFKDRKGYGFEIYKAAGPIPQMYSTRSIPTTYVIDADGNLALTHLGMGDFDTKDFKQFLTELQ